MKIVTYNVNGLRPRISQYGSLLKLLDSFDADIICFQETKLRRQELTADLVMAEGYESFFSCTRTSERGRTGYSGVATFCRVNSAFSSTEVALPLAAEEGFTGVLGGSRLGRGETHVVAAGLEEFEKDELLKVDGEGRCVMTDHGHFVLFNLYGPRAQCDDAERIEFKLNFYKILQKRWESLLCEGRRIIVVGDLNIAPTSLDRCEAGPDFENNEFRRWFRSMLVDNGGAFSDVFRAKHPDRTEAYTCWPQNTGAEEFNYGTRIDHILCAGPCLHQQQDRQDHSFVTCHFEECDILTQYKRWKPGNTLRWKGGQRIKLEGSDHAPVYTSLLQLPNIPKHSTPSLSARYIPMVYGIQQTLVSTLMKRQVAKEIKPSEVSSSFPDGDNILGSCADREKRSFDQCDVPGVPCGNLCSSSQESEVLISKGDKIQRVPGGKVASITSITPGSKYIRSISNNETKKKAKKNQRSQLSIMSFFHKTSIVSNGVGVNSSTNQEDIFETSDLSNESLLGDGQTQNLSQSDSPQQIELESNEPTLDQIEVNTCSSEKNSVALLEWQRIQQRMQNSIPLCKGHKEPCVARVVKKQGPNFGHRFYCCVRAEGPASNPEANCGYFKWAASKSRGK
ncbi:DNA-(apurinic or apyrimidinic site) endonuclease 2 isoform X2 [Humulus lupulus]|uniref:DNA-(apurinic or apyrimidinic site) endonuclease 2 isoform X2 n=1 Tax=Humulus lupulus TaxID=3486 RepID=UPI002B414125|nr:DNA-(apurinic or apyrimidinic site) endonuclease 2 isoform X2 [Humulus lupulus]